MGERKRGVRYAVNGGSIECGGGYFSFVSRERFGLVLYFTFSFIYVTREIPAEENATDAHVIQSYFVNFYTN